jgi:hypothetical protein
VRLNLENNGRLFLITLGIAALAGLISSPAATHAQGVPKFEVDPYWPKPLPGRWVTGEMGGVCVDSHDHVYIAQRVSDSGGMDDHLEGLTND